MKITRIAVHILFVASIVLFFTRSSWVPNLVQFILRNEMNQALIAEPRSPLEASYVFGSGLKATVITLANGAYEEKGVAGVSDKRVIRVFGEPVYGDLDADGDDDAVLMMYEQTGGSGTFYYVAVALNEDGIYHGTDTMFIGDRIAPQTLRIQDGRPLVTYADRAANEPFSTQPHIGKSIVVYVNAKTHTIGELAQNFEGEADPSRMTLEMTQWKWIKTVHAPRTITPRVADKFSLRFTADSRVQIKTDCNTMGATFARQGAQLIIEDMVSTKMTCENSQEMLFADMLKQVTSYSFTSKGELLLKLRDGGVITFR